MSQENVDFVKATFAVWNSGDMAAYAELLDPEIVTHPPPDWPEPGPFHGHDAVIREFELLREAWNDDDVAEPTDSFVDLDDRVLGSWVWRGQGQGPAVTMEMWCIYTVRDSKLTEMDFYLDHAEARRAMGLDED